MPGTSSAPPLPGGRQLGIPPRDLHELQTAARAGQNSKHWEDDYKRRAGIEATISQAITVTGCRRARYRGLAKTRLEHVCAAVAINLHRLNAYWNDTPLDRTRTSHLARLDQTLRLAALTDELAANITAAKRSRRRSASAVSRRAGCRDRRYVWDSGVRLAASRVRSDTRSPR